MRSWLLFLSPWIWSREKGEHAKGTRRDYLTVAGGTTQLLSTLFLVWVASCSTLTMAHTFCTLAPHAQVTEATFLIILAHLGDKAGDASTYLILWTTKRGWRYDTGLEVFKNPSSFLPNAPPKVNSYVTFLPLNFKKKQHMPRMKKALSQS